MAELGLLEGPAAPPPAQPPVEGDVRMIDAGKREADFEDTKTTKKDRLSMLAAVVKEACT